jgi:hypothetical protein
MCHLSMVTGAAASAGAGEPVGATLGAPDAAVDGDVVAPPPEQALNTSAMTPMTPSDRQRVVTA